MKTKLGRALTSRINPNIGHREIKVLREKLNWERECFVVEEVTDSPGPGNVVILELGYERITELITAFGRKGVPAEEVLSRLRSKRHQK